MHMGFCLVLKICFEDCNFITMITTKKNDLYRNPIIYSMYICLPADNTCIFYTYLCLTLLNFGLFNDIFVY